MFNGVCTNMEKTYIDREDNHFSLFSTMRGVAEASRRIKKATDAFVVDYKETGFWDKTLALRLGRLLVKFQDFGATDTASRESWYSYAEKTHSITIPYDDLLFTRCTNLAWAERKR